MPHEYAFTVNDEPVIHQNVGVLQDGTSYDDCSGVMDLEPKRKESKKRKRKKERKGKQKKKKQ
ncbi:hypothetical protein BO82DRAFT_170088 [Aspergillus uvarum CBS 121591]|uniref:Uncharacterized protein n=1 Tax=Aspergillus uvarum CBS 121591 TaxID=1448315 RepID=A0A319C250_9EURO|nr:hypothetical protein BO82DRAFT_170088 [Aspergillus uvarum CBS 121591]PYH77859.1 hypothetical protein BO82DRAFT_170088 [Aspergillus uvarum CBS 121591]